MGEVIKIMPSHFPKLSPHINNDASLALTVIFVVQVHTTINNDDSLTLTVIFVVQVRTTINNDDSFTLTVIFVVQVHTTINNDDSFTLTFLSVSQVHMVTWSVCLMAVSRRWTASYWISTNVSTQSGRLSLKWPCPQSQTTPPRLTSPWTHMMPQQNYLIR